jgi:hypothetical protein
MACLDEHASGGAVPGPLLFSGGLKHGLREARPDRGLMGFGFGEERARLVNSLLLTPRQA